MTGNENIQSLEYEAGTEGVENRSDEIGKTRELSAEEMEQGVCPQCGGELLATGALCSQAGLIIRWECRSCSFVASTEQLR